MAFDKTKIALIAATGFNNLFIYQTSDAPGTVDDSNYFGIDGGATSGSSEHFYQNFKKYDVILYVQQSGVSTGFLTVTSTSGASPVTTVYAAN